MEEALHLIRKSSKYTHMLLASTLMRELANHLDEDIVKWELVGLLHDLDYDLVKEDMTKHGIIASEQLNRRLPDDALYAIKSHDHRTMYVPHSQLDHALIIIDSLTCVIETIDKPLSMDKLEAEIERVSKNKPWHKVNINKCRDLGLTKTELMQLAIQALDDAPVEIRELQRLERTYDTQALDCIRRTVEISNTPDYPPSIIDCQLNTHYTLKWLTKK
ncbi:MAG: HD domain-containing protein, partial [Candidatus Ranarchaeia archaeon]